MLAFGAVLAVWLGGAQRAEASETLWLLTRVDVGEPKQAEVNAARKLAQLLRARGLDVLDGASAASEFERKHSRTAHELPAAEIAKLDAALRKLADELASENLEQAQQTLAEIQLLSPDVRDQLNHETQRARRRFHICLLAAHLFSKEGFKNEASDQVRKCARDFPGLEPEQSPYLPDSIRQFFVLVQKELQTIQPSTVHVDVENGEDEGCRARVNGIDRGTTPATVDDVRTDRVRVQVDCAERDGRIYELALEPGDNSIRIDPELDRAVLTQPALGLRYVDAQAAANNRMLHNLRLARAVGATHILQIWNGELHRIDVESRRDTTIGRLTYRLEELADNVVAPAEVAGGVPLGSPAEADSKPSTFATLGWISAGAAVLAGSGVFVAWRVREGAVGEFNDESHEEKSCPNRFEYETPPDRDCPGYLQTADSAETAMWALGMAGIGFAALSATFFILNAKQPPSEVKAQNGCGLGPGELGMACRVAF
ncbi:MAG TPA: hypothetical protein VJR89_01250 [Polyangiales bacterium]|nr:hypothetical protein [Polyangiales bacterium]